MAHKLKIGSKVKCQYFNTPDNRFYGEFFTGEILSVNNDETKNYLPARQFVLKRDDDSRIVTVARKEIKKVLS